MVVVVVVRCPFLFVDFGQGVFEVGLVFAISSMKLPWYDSLIKS